MSTFLPDILVTGGDGQVASALKAKREYTGNKMTFLNRTQLDITSPTSIKSVLSQYKPSIIINTAAFTAVDKAEEQADAAMQVNHIGAQTLAMQCQQHQIPLIHLSTDYVFDGNKNIGYHEDDTINPISVYGKSKWLGEEAIRNNCETHLILRVSGIYSEYRHNFLKTMFKLAQNHTELRIVDDQITCPTYAGDIATTLIQIANNLKQTGTYHFCSNPPVSWHGFATSIINQFDNAVKIINAIPTSAYPTPAERPKNAVLNCNKIKNDYAILQPEWTTSIPAIISTLKKGLLTT